jgi:hypothetical protein
MEGGREAGVYVGEEVEDTKGGREAGVYVGEEVEDTKGGREAGERGEHTEGGSEAGVDVEEGEDTKGGREAGEEGKCNNVAKICTEPEQDPPRRASSLAQIFWIM